MELLDAPHGRSRLVGVFILLLLVQLVAIQAVGLLPRVIPLDFYQYWGVGAAVRLSGRPLGTPYRNFRDYHATLKVYFADSDQPRLAAVARASTRPGFTATPFVYVLFAALPLDYARALALFQTLQIAAFLLGVFLLGVLYRYQMFPLVCLTLLLAVGSGPFVADLRLGNLGALQLGGLSVLLVLAERWRRARGAAPVLGGATLAVLVLLGLGKPNVAPAAAMMAVHLWLAHGARSVAVAAVPAALLGAAALVAPALYFHSWTAWHEWYRVVFGSNPYTLVRASTGGNYSTALLLGRALQVDVWTVVAGIAVLMAGSGVVVVAASMPRGERGRAMLRPAVDRLFGDARLAMAIGVTAAVALPPLVWYHYYVITLVPGLWLLTAPGSRYLRACGLAGLILSMGLLNVIFLPLGWTEGAALGAAVSWVPLWAGVLLRLGSAGAPETEAAAAAVPPKRERGPGGGRPARRPGASLPG